VADQLVGPSVFGSPDRAIGDELQYRCYLRGGQV
jgi:hypothetical protein